MNNNLQKTKTRVVYTRLPERLVQLLERRAKERLLTVNRMLQQALLAHFKGQF